MKLPRPGELRDLVSIRRRRDMPASGGALDPIFSVGRDADAKVEPVGTAVYLAGVQTDDKITHRVFLRREMALGIDSDCELVCDSIVYRVRRCSDIAGAQRFSVVEVEEIGREDGHGY